MYRAPSIRFQIMMPVRSHFISENNKNIVEHNRNSVTAVTSYLRMLAKTRIWSLYNRVWKGDLDMQQKNNERCGVAFSTERNMKNRGVCSGYLQHFEECGGKSYKQDFQTNSLKLNI